MKDIISVTDHGAGPSQFRVASIGEYLCTLASYNRRDFYKISLILTGRGKLLYANREIEVKGPILLFSNPFVPYSWESVEGAEHDGYFCVFTDQFIQEGGRPDSLQHSPLFKPGGEPVYILDEFQASYIRSIFSRMRQEVDTEYLYKYDVIRSQVNLIIHEAIKMQPAVAYFTPHNAAARISNLFLTLLEKQFPVDVPRYPLALKRAGDYADKLSVHVNHLNAAVQEVTGKSTTAHINEKIVSEARSLLKHTDWSVADIAYGLGFEYASYFNNFIKKHTGFTPLQIRKEKSLLPAG
ncbi:AraC family transcriptional regulator [Chitinophaga sp. S165]|uniref:helix-turn-helix domain-containing protein n=1 Tax=Chitinophaga sp. S165 TaxID=2135462 RepID=UPI000D719A3A|nr:helix-turn-helix domain-containing protein [Chitinophaga sp. S165]PWV47038.1 helix-turn-helix protein [Chitinophaga sp. S165]